MTWIEGLWEQDAEKNRILGPKRDDVTGGRRKLHIEELRDLYSSPNIIRMKWREIGRAYSMKGKDECM
jgi:hypothetical protein